MLTLSLKMGQAIQIGDTFVRVDERNMNSVKLVILSDEPVHLRKEGLPPGSTRRRTQVALDIPPAAWGITNEASAS